MRSAAPLAMLVLTACASPAPSGPTDAPSPRPSPSPPLTSLGSPLPFEGEYELSVSVDAACAREFPPRLRIRRYAVRVQTLRDRSVIDLEGPLYTTPSWPPGRPAGTAYVDETGLVALSIGFTEVLSQTPVPGDDNFVIAEELRVNAESWAPMKGATLEGALSGEIIYWTDTALPPRASCTSDCHDFYLRPR